MPPTACPKLRRVRELLRDEERAKIRDSRLQRQRDAIERWRGAPANGGNEAFFQLGVDLRATGMPLPDIETTLHQELTNARHPTERRGQIRSIIQTLSRGGLLTAA
jgi:hypothetical protein